MKRFTFVLGIIGVALGLSMIQAAASFNPPPKPVYAVLIVQQATVLDCHQPSVPLGSPAYCRGNYTDALTDASVFKTVKGFTYSYYHQSVVCVPAMSVWGPWACQYGAVA